MLVLDDCIRLGWKDPSWPVDRLAARIPFGSHEVTADFKTRFMAALDDPIQTWSKRMEGIAVDDQEPIFEGEDQWPESLEPSSVAKPGPQWKGGQRQTGAVEEEKLDTVSGLR